MAFGGGGGFSFGGTNNQSTGFGGFGSNNNSTTNAFGSTSNSGGFGSSTTANNPFSSGASTAFGSNTGGGFGSNSSGGGGLFGNKTGGAGLFGSSNTTSTNTGGGLFGNTSNTSGGFGASSGGFGASTNNNNAFGSNTGSSTFGGFGATANKPAFGAGSGSTLFGQGGSGTTGGFGTSTGTGFGGSGTALGQGVPPCQGTAVVPFQVTQEKDPAGAGMMQNFQSINFMEPYSKYSFEELRLADYNAGRQFGNGATQPAGAFGASTFGGFGSNNNNTTGGFGASTTTNNPFGSNNTTSGGFGSNTGGGGLFGNKPAGGGLFGQQSSSTSTGGLFGTSNNNTTSNPFSTNSTSTGFGSNTGGGGLFGNNNNQQKPGGLFGNTSTTTPSTGFSFGGNNNQQQSSTTGGGLFGNNNQQQSTGGGLFGNTNNQAKPGGLFGNSTTGGAFGSNTSGQTSGGLFGTSNNASSGGGGLFGNNAASTTNTGGGLFGNTQSNNTGGGLFGSAANTTQSKPGGLFGNSTFGNNQQQSTGGGLFGNASNNQASTGGSLFGNTNNSTGGAFSFGGNNQNKPAGTSLFGNTSTNNNQSGGLFGNSASGSNPFGNSMGQSMQQSGSEVKHASLLDPNPYGQSSIWTGLPTVTAENAKPLVTALTASQQLKESQAKPPPNLRLNQSRYMTPPRRGYGFTYSTYGTPNSAASTPGGNSLSTSMYGSRFTGGSFGRSMGKSASISNMRSYYSDGESVLAPGAFTPSSSRYSSGSIRRLTIDRSIREDLFNRPALPAPSANSNNASPTARITNGVTSPQPATAPSESTPESIGSKLKKRVSFDKEATGGQNGELNSQSGAVVRVEADEEATPPANGTVTPPEQARNNSLAAVPEDRESEHVATPKPNENKHDPQPGEYWSKPTEDEIKAMSREQASQYRGFQVGRQGCGFVTFDGPVDLKSLLPLQKLYGGIIDITVRSISVYPDSSTKPARGKGLNVPSTLSIENSWPRNRGKPEGLAAGPVFDKHIRRLKAIGNTEFVSYNVNTGVWVFKVPHYTRYGLDYDDDDEDGFGDSQLSAPPDSIKAPEDSVMEIDSDHTSTFDDEDTFHGKQMLTVPGGFGRQSAIDVMDEPVMKSIEHDSPRSEQSAFSEEEASEDDMDMAGSYPAPNEIDSPVKAQLPPGTPGRPLIDIDLNGDWAEQLQRTISPRKQNRDALREAQSKVLLDREFSPIKPGTIGKQGFRTSIDVMNAIFNKRDGQTESAGFEFPYSRRARTFDENETDMSDMDKAWHASFKPHFTAGGNLIVKARQGAVDDELWESVPMMKSHNRTVQVAGLKWQKALDIKQLTRFAMIGADEQHIPNIKYEQKPFSTYLDILPPSASPTEYQLYKLLHILFDDYEDEYNTGLNDEQRKTFDQNIRKDRLSAFLSQVLSDAAINPAQDAIDAALQQITAGNTEQASKILLEGKNTTLSLLVAQLPQADRVFQDDIEAQITAWREQRVLSEIDINIRAIYEILAGNTTISAGKDGAVEHKAETFSISEHFGLGWLTMFAVNLWYGPHKNDDLEDVISDFAEKISSGAESASPVLVDDKGDPLWVMLSLYASMSKKVAAPEFPEALSALAVPSDFDSLALLRAHFILEACLPGDLELRVDENKADGLSLQVSSELEWKGDIAGAVFALLHLHESQKRADALRSLLLRNAAVLPPPPTSEREQAHHAWKTLATELLVPEQWLYQALAQLARAQGDSEQQLRYLIKANDVDAAHQCFIESVAPVMVVDEDWTGLDEMADLILSNGQVPHQWADGGCIYADFATLAGGHAKQQGRSREELLFKLRVALGRCGRQLAGDTGVSKSSSSRENEGIEQVRRRVAVREMARWVAEQSEGEQDVQGVLQLPLTGEVKGRLGREVAGRYYRNVMAGGGVAMT